MQTNRINSVALEGWRQITESSLITRPHIEPRVGDSGTATVADVGMPPYGTLRGGVGTGHQQPQSPDQGWLKKDGRRTKGQDSLCISGSIRLTAFIGR